MPRTVEVELRGDLVDTCLPGDVVTVSGIVRSIRAEALSRGRGGMKDGKQSSLFLLYMLANAVENRRAEERVSGERPCRGVREMREGRSRVWVGSSRATTLSDFVQATEGAFDHTDEGKGWGARPDEICGPCWPMRWKTLKDEQGR